ncbi:hypothetical protein [Prochlorococcus marinus]|uniref:hypothetical protein n=1 Tax=Prochlorococcus TaxID=1218 RepID=UPI0007B36525|nr:hypothetical protein [Prochlorococcus marinus]
MASSASVAAHGKEAWPLHQRRHGAHGAMQTRHQGVLERCATPMVMSAGFDQCSTALEVKVERDDTPQCNR